MERHLKTENELRKAAQNFRSILENAIAGVFQTKTNGEILYANKALADIYEFDSIEELKKEGIVARYKNPDDRKKLLEQLERFGKVNNFEFEAQTKKGGKRCILINSIIVGEEIIGMALDITKWREALSAQQKSEERYKNIVETAYEGVWVFNKKHEVIYVNRRMTEMLGYSENEMLGKPVFDFLDERREEIYFKKGGEERRRTGIRERRVKKNDGSFLWVIEAVSTLTNSKSETVGILGMITDISDRKRAEEKLKRSEERYALAQEVANIGSWEWDIATSKLKWSEQIEPIFGFKKGEFEKTYEAFLERVHPEDRQFVIDSVNACLKDNKDYNIEHRIVWPDGTVRWVSENGDVFFNENDKPIRMLGVVQDITERKKTQEELKEAHDKLEIKVKERTEELKRNYDTQRVINDLLKLSLDDMPLDAFLKKALKLLLSVPWLTFNSKGAIFLVEEDPNKLRMKASSGFSEDAEMVCETIPFGRCICGKAAAKKELFFTEKVDKQHDIVHENEVPHGHYCVPIMYSGEVIGLINLYVTEGHKQRKMEADFLEAIANSLASIIQRRKAEEAQKNAEQKIFDSYKYLGVVNRQISILLNFNRVSGGKNVKEIARYIIDSAINLSGAKISILYRFNENDRSFELISANCPSEKREIYSAVLGRLKNLSKKLIETKSRVQGVFSGFMVDQDEGRKISYALALPITKDEKLKGALFLGFDGRKDITTQELDFYDAFALQTSVALRDLDIFDRKERRE